MCGSAGIYAYRESALPVDRQELLRIREAMLYRGADGGAGPVAGLSRASSLTKRPARLARRFEKPLFPGQR